MNWVLANDFGRLRGLEVVRGWIVVAVLLGILAAIPLALWQIGLGGIGLVGGLAVLGLLVVAYSVSSGR